MDRWSRALVLLSGAAFAAAPLVAAPSSPPEGPRARVFWEEHFAASKLDWVDVEHHGEDELARVYTLRADGPMRFLHARHDGGDDHPPKAMHIGKVLEPGAPLDQVRALRWRWRAVHHPSVSTDPWLDMALGVYVVVRPPSLLRRGRGFKFGWLAKPAAPGAHQGGLLEIELRHEAPTTEWRSESVDLCALFQREYGGCAGEVVRYVGVTTDGDGTRSLAEGDYADFELIMQ